MRYNELDLLVSLFGWGSMDIDFLLKELENYNVDLDDLSDYMEEMGYFDGGKIDINYLIGGVYDLAVDTILNELEIIEYKDEANGFEIDTFLNCLDSHLYVKYNGETTEIYSYKELYELLESIKEQILSAE